MVFNSYVRHISLHTVHNLISAYCKLTHALFFFLYFWNEFEVFHIWLNVMRMILPVLNQTVDQNSQTSGVNKTYKFPTVILE